MSNVTSQYIIVLLYHLLVGGHVTGSGGVHISGGGHVTVGGQLDGGCVGGQVTGEEVAGTEVGCGSIGQNEVNIDNNRWTTARTEIPKKLLLFFLPQLDYHT